MNTVHERRGRPKPLLEMHGLSLGMECRNLLLRKATCNSMHRRSASGIRKSSAKAFEPSNLHDVCAEYQVTGQISNREKEPVQAPSSSSSLQASQPSERRNASSSAGITSFAFLLPPAPALPALLQPFPFPTAAAPC